MKKKIIVLAVCLAVATALYFGLSIYKKTTAPKKLHYHAGFIVFDNGKKKDFSDFRFMSVKPCTEENHEDSDDEIQIEKAHLHDNVGDVVHVERSGAVWQDLFKNIRYKIDYKTSTGYINGERVENFENKPIGKDDALVVFVGRDNNIRSHLSMAPKKDYIEEKASKSVDCD